MQRTDIEYLTHTYNPIAMRCTPNLSDGCDHCWHLGFAKRHAGNDHFSDKVRAAYRGGEPVLREKELVEPLRRKKPAVIGCQFMGDLFHEKVDMIHIGKVFGVMSSCHDRHKFLVLTKRPERAVEYFKLFHIPSNLTLGVSASNQADLDRVVGPLLECPAACRVVSLEPLLGEVELTAFFCNHCRHCGSDSGEHPGRPGNPKCLDCGRLLHAQEPYDCSAPTSDPDELWVPPIDGIIAGGESGKVEGIRPTHPDWLRGARDQCAAASVPFYLKQNGEWLEIQFDKRRRGDVLVHPTRGVIPDLPGVDDPGFARTVAMRRVGNAKSGRLLDGKEHNALPKGLRPCA